MFAWAPGGLYSTTNTVGSVLALLYVIGMILLLWRKQAKAGEATVWPTWNPLHYFKKDERGKFNPVFFLLCYAAAYLLLMQSLRWSSVLFSTYVGPGGGLRVSPAVQVAFASGVLVFIPVFLLLARFFPGNGRATRQLELIFPAFALHHVFNRLACLFGGCCFGVPVRMFGIAYPQGSRASITYGVGTRLFPNLLIEIGVMLLLFAALVWLNHRGKRTLPIFPLVFGATGFLLGFVTSHTHERLLEPMFGFTQPTPFTHLLVFFVGVAFLVLVMRERKRKPATEPELEIE